jgi:hypothetical protein
MPTTPEQVAREILDKLAQAPSFIDRDVQIIAAALRSYGEARVKEVELELERKFSKLIRSSALEEAAKVAENQAIAGIAGACARDEIVEAIRALLPPEEEKP